MQKIKQIVNSLFCLECLGCCRFREKVSVWKPHGINLVKHNDYYICPLFDLTTNSCLDYQNRPFDCLIYPFLLHREKGKYYLALHSECCFVRENTNNPEFEKLLSTSIKLFAGGKIKKFMSTHRNLFLQYPGELIILKEISFGDDIKTNRFKRKETNRKIS
jgi:uncharacterized cysteine cluster protein YcgN (CxxCxxCC family)